MNALITMYAGGALAVAFALAVVARHPMSRPALRERKVKPLFSAMLLCALWLPMLAFLVVRPTHFEKPRKRRRKFNK